MTDLFTPAPPMDPKGENQHFRLNWQSLGALLFLLSPIRPEMQMNETG
jgi:hypothetical protein